MLTPTRDSASVTLLCSLVLASALLLAGGAEDAVVSSFVIATGLLLLGVGFLMLEGRRGMVPVGLIRLFFVAYCLRVGFMTAWHFVVSGADGLPVSMYRPGGGDDLYFHALAGSWAESMVAGAFWGRDVLQAEVDERAWILPIAVVRFFGQVLGGDTFYNAKLVSAWCSALLVPYCYLLADRVCDGRDARVAARIALFAPDFWVYGSHLLRDIMIALVVAVVFHNLAPYRRPRRSLLWRGILTVVMTAYAVGNLKVWLPEFVFVSSLLCLLWGWTRTRPVLGAGLLCCVVSGGLLLTLGDSPVTTALAEIEAIGEPQGLLQRLEVQGSQKGGGSENSLGQALADLPVGVRAVIGVPQLIANIPPWAAWRQYGLQPWTALEAAAAALWLVMVAFLPSGLARMWRERRVEGVWIWGPMFLLCAGLAAASTLLPRWRLVVMPFLIVASALGLSSRRDRWLAHLSGVGLVGLLGGYSILKHVH